MTLQKNTGYDALKAMAHAPAFNKWMYSVISPYAYGNILEIGSGLGNISVHFLKNNASIILSDIDDYYIGHLQQQFKHMQLGKSLLKIDLQKENFLTHYTDLTEKFDTVILINVLEHLENENDAIQNCRFLLKKNGTLIVLVPAFSFLFSEMDKALKHFRRYTRGELKEKIQKQNFIIKKSFYFNALGIVAWLYGKILKLKSPPDSNMKFFDRLTPFGKLLDKLVFNKTGLSALVIATKNESAT